MKHPDILTPKIKFNQEFFNNLSFYELLNVEYIDDYIDQINMHSYKKNVFIWNAFYINISHLCPEFYKALINIMQTEPFLLDSKLEFVTAAVLQKMLLNLMNKVLYHNNDQRLRAKLIDAIKTLCIEHSKETTHKVKKVRYVRDGVTMVKKYWYDYRPRSFCKKGLHIFLPNQIITSIINREYVKRHKKRTQDNIITAFLMGTHARVGCASPIQCFDDNIVHEIVMHIKN